MAYTSSPVVFRGGLATATVLGTFAAIASVSIAMPRPVAAADPPAASAEQDDADDDPLRAAQQEAMEKGSSPIAHWGVQPGQYSSWTNHSNRLIPVYTFGIGLDAFRGDGNPYRSPDRLESLYGRVPENTLNPDAEYFDQTDVYRLQQQALAAGKKHIILIVFDGMDWPTTRAAAIYHSGKNGYDEGRGTGLSFLDYDGTSTDFGYFVTSPRLGGLKTDVDAQRVIGGEKPATGGYDASVGGDSPWATPTAPQYLLGRLRTLPHTVTDSAASATSLTAGVKTYNAAINYGVDSQQVEPIARQLQRERGWAVGAVSSVPVSHATPAAAYANNVSRNDYQDLTRDLVGLPSASHRQEPLPGLDVLIGGGWGESKDRDEGQGANYVAGNRYLPEAEIEKISTEAGGRYIVAQRTPGEDGGEVLARAALEAAEGPQRLFGFFGGQGGHLPFQTADGDYNPARDVKGIEKYSEADISENPTLAEMATAALRVLEKDPEGFWLMIEAGDVDWANHANNLDSSIGAVLSGDAAFRAATEWVEANDAWPETAIILTADHGHFLVIDDPQAIASAGAR